MVEVDLGELEPLGFMLGKWQGRGEGFGTVSDVDSVCLPVIQNKFIQCRTRSTAYGADGRIVETHEDWEIFSYDPDRKTLVMRGFYSEGYVNVYVLDSQLKSDNTLVFTSERTEGAGGMRARQRFHLESPDDYTVALELARPGDAFRECQVIRMKKVT